MEEIRDQRILDSMIYCKKLFTVLKMSRMGIVAGATIYSYGYHGYGHHGFYG